MPERKTRVAILGGGAGGISAAFWLSASQSLRDRFEVTVYTQGWRLGGKCASGRNADHCERIEEHGLHLLLGYYEIAFATLRAAYALTRKEGDLFQSWEDALKPQRLITLPFEVPNGAGGSDFDFWTIDFPPLPGTPGEPDPDFLIEAVKRLIGALERELWPTLKIIIRQAPLAGIVEAADALFQLESFHRLSELAEALSADAENASDSLKQELQRLLIWFHGVLAEPVRRHSAEGHRIYVLVSLALAGLAGYLEDVLPHGESGFARLDEIDFRDWLRAHGAPDDTLGFGPVQAIYDLAFAYRNGDVNEPAAAKIAAGAALRCAAKIAFGYRNAPLWRMQAGAGDTIFTPLYKYLIARQVRVEFFHRVRNLRLAPDRRHIAAIELDRQVALKANNYNPLRNVKGLDCWPSQPLWDQIVDGDELKGKDLSLESDWCTFNVGQRTLARGDDFDIVVLAMPPMAAAPISSELVAGSNRWAAMLANMTAVPTQSVQLWLNPSLSGIGWADGATVMTSYVEALSTWADMSHLLARENRTPGAPPRSCQYLCGAFAPPEELPPAEDPAFIAEQTELVRTGAEAWLKNNAGKLWPKVCANGKGLDPAQVGEAFYRVNIDRSEQYVQTFPGSTKFRLAPGDSGFEDAFLAGDWTLSSINGGSVEAAFESGKRAAEAIAGAPSPERPD
jgi:uncharacterized protein with NAD-binding domain and iron-sulfur cluster